MYISAVRASWWLLLQHSGQSSSTMYHPACHPIMKPGFHPPSLPHYRVKIRAASCALKTERERHTSIIHGICGYVEWTGRSKLGTFAPTLASLRGEPITTSVLQSRAKITEIPPSSPELGQGAAWKMSTLLFPIQLAPKTLAGITHPLHSLPANDSTVP